jgi:hypothetical protein
MVKLLQDENLRRQFEVAALKKVRDEFTLEKCVESFKKEYENLSNVQTAREKKTAEVLIQ